MKQKKDKTKADLRGTVVSLKLAVSGLILIVIGSSFQAVFVNIDIDVLVSNLGALLLIIGLLQWLFDSNVRSEFTATLREDIIGSKRVSESGNSDYFHDSKMVSFDELFLSGSSLIIGVNYSSKLIDNAIDLLKTRTVDKKQTTILMVKTGGAAFSFLNHDFNSPGIDSNIKKIHEIVDSIDVERKFIRVTFVDTVLRYSFVLFDSRIWIIVGTNGKGRRAVPGFYVSRGGSWYDHFSDDIKRLMETAE